MTYQDLPTATRVELVASLNSGATLSQSDVLDQVVRLDDREREDRMLKLQQDMRDLTSQIRLLSLAAVAARGAAIAVAFLK